MKHAIAITASLLLAAPPALARPVLVEMFTSQSCSSCPPANALLQRLKAQDHDILPLSFDVTYWNDLGWKDTDSLSAATKRQYWYASLRNSTEVYTPEAVVDGKAQFVGSNESEMRAAIAAAKAAPAGDVPIGIARNADRLALSVGTGKGAGSVLLLGYDNIRRTGVKAGENGGATITEVNVVRAMVPLGSWHGAALTFQVHRPAGQHVAVILQAMSGEILGLGIP
ncbi:MAG: DUF1223 domain-containing protein [Rhodospirillales bacterium]|nr:DUF1223 domain-containing protein [Rhodospirillales bacterium]